LTKFPIPVLLLVRKLDHGGCERDLSKIAISGDPAIFEFHVGCFRPEGIRVQELRDAGLPILHLPVTSFRSSGAVTGALKLNRYIRDHNIRVVHCFDGPTAMFAAPVAKMGSAGAVLTSQLSYRSLNTPLERRMLRLSDLFADRVVVNCEAMRRHMVEDEGLPPAKTFLCYNGVDTRVFYPSADAAPPSPDKPLVIGTVANLRREKGVDLLIRAFATCRPADRPVQLLIVGSGPCEQDCITLAREVGVEQTTTFFRGKPDITAEVRSIDIFVLPSYSEAFSNSLLEAMASGCAVIGSNVGGTPELIRGDTGLLFTPGDHAGLASQIQALINDESRRRRLASAATAFSRTFSLQRNLETITSLYRAMADR
jgi:glycosyltransferase involved in cell wall biosynthesis